MRKAPAKRGAVKVIKKIEIKVAKICFGSDSDPKGHTWIEKVSIANVALASAPASESRIPIAIIRAMPIKEGSNMGIDAGGEVACVRLCSSTKLNTPVRIAIG